MFHNKNLTVMTTIKNFEDMDVWQEAVKMGADVYKVTQGGKMVKDFNAKDQLGRAAISVSNNIAEGFEYNNSKTFIRFLMYAKGSAGEVRSQLFVLKEAGMIEADKVQPMWENALKLSKNTGGFRKYLRAFEKQKPDL